MLRVKLCAGGLGANPERVRSTTTLRRSASLQGRLSLTDADCNCFRLTLLLSSKTSSYLRRRTL